MSDLRIETMRPGFDKIHLGDGRVLHWITTPDGEEFHDHPFAIEVQVLFGSYQEAFGDPLAPDYDAFYPGETRLITADDAHRIVTVEKGGCLTLCTYGPHERETRFYRLRDGKVQSRLHNGSYEHD